MAKRVRRYGASVLTVGVLAGAAALLTDGITMPETMATMARPVTEIGPTPAAIKPAAQKAVAQKAVAQKAVPNNSRAARNLHVAPEKLVPDKVSASHPARIVTTTIGHDGRPTISVHTAKDRAGAVAHVRRAQRTKGAVGVELDVPVKVADVGTAGDPFRGYQWDLGTVHAPEAWGRTTGAGVTVAVLDSGVDVTHPDLAGQVLPGADLTDGTVGPSHDVHGHGTHVAGTIAAAAGNGMGIAGVAPDVKILPVRVLGDDGAGYMSVAAAGVVWAADHGADVINLSISGASAEESMTTAIEYARSRGTVVIAAAGNERQKGNPAAFPAAQPGVIAVAATDRSDNVASFSTAADYVDIAAPGYGIVSTYPGGRYAGMSGTSMAAPHVAAAAALLRSIDHSLAPDQVEQILESSAVDLGAPGRDSDFGDGRLDITAALAAAPAVQPTPADVPSPAAEPTQGTESTPEPAQNDVSVRIGAGPATRSAAFGESTATAFTVTAAGEPIAGRQVDLCVSVDDTDDSCTRAVTAADGTVAWNQTATAPFQVRLAVPGSDATATVVYRVRATATIVPDGPGSAVVSVQGVDGQSVVLQTASGGAWPTVQRFPAGARVRITGLARGTYRVVLPMTRRFDGMISAPIGL